MTGSSAQPLLDLAQQGQPVHARHVDVGQDHDQLAARSRRQASPAPPRPNAAKCMHVGALPHLAAEALAEQLGDIGLVIDDQDADAHARSSLAAAARRLRGRRTVNSVNSPGSLSTSIVPPCCCVTMS